jgi:hypothetical protein
MRLRFAVPQRFTQLAQRIRKFIGPIPASAVLASAHGLWQRSDEKKDLCLKKLLNFSSVFEC